MKASTVSQQPTRQPAVTRLDIVIRGLQHRCPNCGGNGVFRGLFKTNKRCDRCNFLIEREDGFFLGAMALNYAAGAFPLVIVFVLVFTLREPLLASRDAIGLPQDSLDLWRGALTGEEGALLPSDVWWVVALSLSAAVAAALIARAVARRIGLRLIEAVALPAALIGAGLGIWLSGLGPHALDLMYRVDITVTTGRGSPIMALIGVALLTFGQVMLLMGAGMDAQRDEDYVLTGRAKGLADHVVRDRHVARNAIPPVLAGSFLTFPTVLAGMMIIEFELEMAGLSSVLFDAIESQDIPVIMGILVVLGLVGVVCRVVLDVAIATLDPRRRGARA